MKNFYEGRSTVVCKFAVLAVFVCSFSGIVSAQTFNYDGVINESFWGPTRATSAGGPVPGFGVSHEINAVYVVEKGDSLHFAIAGNVQDGNRILMFIDSKTGGVNGGGFGTNFPRDNTPAGLNRFNYLTTFDAGFFPDYCLIIGTDFPRSDFYFDLKELLASPSVGASTYLGSAFEAGSTNRGASPANSSNTLGFEIGFSKSSLGFVNGTDLKLFLAYISDAGFLSNQFLTPAGASDGNYTDGTVDFSAATPNPITIPYATLPVSLESFEGAVSKGIATLHWSTSLELNFSHFLVERADSPSDWTVVGQVAAMGGTQKQADYQFTDQTPIENQASYRLQMVDLDGSQSYSAAIELLTKEGPFVIAKQATGLWQVDGLPANSPSQIFVSDMQGQLLVNQSITQSRATLSLRDFPAGVYIIRVENELGVQVQKIVQ